MYVLYPADTMTYLSSSTTFFFQAAFNYQLAKQQLLVLVTYT